MLYKIFRFFIHHFVKILLSVLIREFIKSVRRDETAKFGLFWRKETAQETELNLLATRKLARFFPKSGRSTNAPGK